MIPKRIIYTWFGNNEVPKDVKKCQAGWKKNNPEYEILEINERNFDIHSFKFTAEAYQSENWAFVSDVARIWAVNKFGGIYVDTDVEILKPLDKLLDVNQFWAKEDAGQVASGLIFGSLKDDEVLQEILDAYAQLEFTDENKGQLSTVKIISHILRKHGLKNNKKFNLLDNGAVVYPPVYFAPLHYWGGGKISKKTLTVHHYNASWTGKKGALANYLGHQLMYYVPSIGKLIRKLKYG